MLVVAERWVDVWSHWVEAHPARLIGTASAGIGAVLAAVDGVNVTTLANVGVLTFTLSAVTLIVRALLVVIRGERAANREMRAQIAAHAAQLADDNIELRHRVAELERQLLGDGR